MTLARTTATTTTPSQAARPAADQGTGPQQADPIDQLRQRFAKHDRPLAEVRRLVDASMGERLLTDELRALRDDA